MEVSSLNRYDFARPSTIAYWPFNGDSSDGSQNGYDLTEGLGDDYDIGKFGQSVMFAETGIRMTNAESAFRIQNMSISFWMKNTNNVSQVQTIFSVSDHDGSNAYGFYIATYQTYIVFLNGDGASANWNSGLYSDGSINPVDDNWHWVVITRSNYDTLIYIDGKFCSYGDTGNEPVVYLDTEKPSVGVQYLTTYDDPYNTPWYNFYYGYIDDMHISSNILTPATIRQMYAFQMGWL